MSSKTLQFKETNQTKTKKLLYDLTDMSDISFNTVAIATKNSVDIEMLSAEESIIQSLKNLMSLPIGGNVLFPERGETVGNMLFAPGLSQNEAHTMLTSYLNANEPRINVLNVTSSKTINDFNEQIITLNVSYSFKNSEEIHNTIVDLKSTID